MPQSYSKYLEAWPWVAQRKVKRLLYLGFEVIIFFPQKMQKNRKYLHGNFHSMRKNSQLFRFLFLCIFIDDTF